MSLQIVICGGGIAGLTAALALNARGFTNIRVLERSHSVQPLGSGINLLPHAVRELDALGVLDDLIPGCIQTSELIYMNHHGDEIWREKRGKAAGYFWPQLSIHRGWLQTKLYEKVVDELGPEVLRVGMEALDIMEIDNRHAVVCLDRSNKKIVTHEADLIIGADGIRSAIRKILVPEEGDPPGNGSVIFRGTVWGEPFLSGSSMIIAGDGVRKIVLYPMARKDDSDQVLLNWAAAAPENPWAGYTKGDWNLPIDSSNFAPEFKNWKIAGINPEKLMLDSLDTFVYPMVDREPLTSWIKDDCIVLIGDAAHAMYPIGSNGATQSIIDANALAYYLGSQRCLKEALEAFESDRREKVTKLQFANRRHGPEVVIDIANERAPNGFSNTNQVFEPDELEKIASGYRKTCLMEHSKVNAPSPYYVNLYQ